MWISGPETESDQQSVEFLFFTQFDIHDLFDTYVLYSQIKITNLMRICKATIHDQICFDLLWMLSAEN